MLLGFRTCVLLAIERLYDARIRAYGWRKQHRLVGG